MIQKLLALYDHTGPERVGFVLENDLVEVQNIHPDPDKNFEVKLEDLDYYEDRSWAIYHTQPGMMSQLSYQDYSGYLNFPDHIHIVVGADGLRSYIVKGNAIMKHQFALA